MKNLLLSACIALAPSMALAGNNPPGPPASPPTPIIVTVVFAPGASDGDVETTGMPTYFTVTRTNGGFRFRLNLR